MREDRWVDDHRPAYSGLLFWLVYVPREELRLLRERLRGASGRAS